MLDIILGRLDEHAEQQLSRITRTEQRIMDALEHITSVVAKTEAVMQQAVDILASIPDRIRAASNDSAALETLANELDGHVSQLQSAVGAVPAMPAPDPDPVDPTPVDPNAPVDTTTPGNTTGTSTDPAILP